MTLKLREMAALLDVSPSTVSESAGKGWRAAGYPVSDWAVRSQDGRIIEYEVPKALVDALTTPQVGPPEAEGESEPPEPLHADLPDGLLFGRREDPENPRPAVRNESLTPLLTPTATAAMHPEPQPYQGPPSAYPPLGSAPRHADEYAALQERYGRLLDERDKEVLRLQGEIQRLHEELHRARDEAREQRAAESERLQGERLERMREVQQLKQELFEVKMELRLSDEGVSDERGPLERLVDGHGDRLVNLFEGLAVGVMNVAAMRVAEEADDDGADELEGERITTALPIDMSIPASTTDDVVGDLYAAIIGEQTDRLVQLINSLRPSTPLDVWLEIGATLLVQLQGRPPADVARVLRPVSQQLAPQFLALPPATVLQLLAGYGVSLSKAEQTWLSALLQEIQRPGRKTRARRQGPPDPQ